jgi:hypothetical protein
MSVEEHRAPRSDLDDEDEQLRLAIAMSEKESKGDEAGDNRVVRSREETPEEERRMLAE